MVRFKPCVARSQHALWYRMPGLFRAQMDSAGDIQWMAEKDLPEELVAEWLTDAVIPEALQRRG